MVMAKAAIANPGVFETVSSAGLPAVYGSAVTVVVTTTPHKNPDGSAVKDTRQ